MNITLVRGRSSDAAIYKVAETLSKNRFNVKLLVWDKQNIWTKEKIIENQNRNGYLIEPFSLKAPEDNWKVYFYFPIWVLYELYYLIKDDCDVIHANDLDTLWPAIIVKLLRKKKLCYTIYDFYANNLIATHFKLVVNIGRKFLAWLEKFGIRFTEVLFLIDENRYDEIKGSKIKKLAYIYNSPQDCFIDEKMSYLGTSKSLKNEFIIFYAGMIYNTRGIEYMIKAIEGIEGVKLVIGGTGPDIDLFNKLSDSQKKKVQYIGRIPTYREVLKMTMDADLLFRFNDPLLPSSKYGSPNKLYEAMMCGKPIIVNSEFMASKIVARENCGLAVPYGDIKAIRDAVTCLINKPEYCKELGLNGRKAYEDKYSWDIMEQRIVGEYNYLKNGTRKI